MRSLVGGFFGDSQPGLYGAAHRGDVAEMRRLVAAGADVNEPGFGGVRPLQWAAVRGQVEATRLLAEMGADFNVLDDASACSPLHSAAGNGHVEVSRS